MAVATPATRRKNPPVPVATDPLHPLREHQHGCSGGKRCEGAGHVHERTAPRRLLPAGEERPLVEVGRAHAEGKLQHGTRLRATEPVDDPTVRCDRDDAATAEPQRAPQCEDQLRSELCSTLEQPVEHERHVRRLVLEILRRAFGVGLPGERERRDRGERKDADREHDHRDHEAGPQMSLGWHRRLPAVHASNRYPTPRTVLIAAASPSFLRTCAMCTSTVRASPNQS